jgi:DNA-directed RNA polymerase subunit RPC12/RpoP
MKLVPSKCPNCGADVQLDDSKDKMFCSYCGCQILVQDEISKIKIVNNPTKENYIKLAQRSLKDKQYDEAYNYYNKTLELDPDNWEAVYNKGLCAAWKSTLANCRIEELMKSYTNALSIITQNHVSLDITQLVFKFAVDIFEVTMAFATLNAKHYKEFWELKDSANEYWVHLLRCSQYLEHAYLIITDGMCDQSQDIKDAKVEICKSVIEFDCDICKSRKYKSGYSNGHPTYATIWINDTTRSLVVSNYNRAVQAIKKLDNSYTPPIIKNKKPGCYIATAVYGSYDAPEVITLRRFRDEVLQKSICGRLFVNIYYCISPCLAEKLKGTKHLNYIVKCLLNKWVVNLRNKRNF